ncbi:hypothetical protein PMIN06_005055 [Paraphaeosphaeria minitans]|uniref:Uncharacterized protein n=1 Tax=Paraphaeosphaeria minitans TaxID=565426 RepID=A0A9P6G910_9PLEO|nr:hypothetical protein PMIN01_10804 [Paraphaeosphaeria minitans]
MSYISKLSPEEIDTYIALLEAKARAASSKPASLADRVTRDNVKNDKPGEKAKKTLSAEKVKKIEKKKQLRITTKEEWRAKKAAGAGTEEASKTAPTAPTAAPMKSPVRVAKESAEADNAAETAAPAAPTKSPVRTAKEATEVSSVATPAKSPIRTESNTKPAARRDSTTPCSSSRARSVSVAAPELPHPEDVFDDLEY